MIYTSYRLSMELKALGLKQDTYFYWQKDKTICTCNDIYISESLRSKFFTSAFTDGELNQYLPETISDGNDTYTLQIGRSGKLWYCAYSLIPLHVTKETKLLNFTNFTNFKNYYIVYDVSETEAKGKVLKKLIYKNLVKITP